MGAAKGGGAVLTPRLKLTPRREVEAKAAAAEQRASEDLRYYDIAKQTIEAVRAATGPPDENDLTFVPVFRLKITVGELKAIMKVLGVQELAPSIKKALDAEV